MYCIINLMNRILNLYRLQQTDSRLDDIKNRLSAIDSIINNDVTLQTAKAENNQASLALQAAEKVIKQQDSEIQALKIKMEQVEASLYSGRIQNPKELKDLQTEIESHKRHLSVLEDKLLEHMMAAEELLQTATQTQNHLIKTEEQLASQHGALHAEMKNLIQEIETLHIERDAVSVNIEAILLNEYQGLREKKRGKAIASISDGSCEACGNMLAPHQQQAARAGQIITHCPGCGRILYST